MIRRAKSNDLKQIMEIIHRIIPIMQSGGIDQWDHTYPNEAVIDGCEQGYQSIRLDTSVKNKPAIKLYLKLGYKKLGTISFRNGLFYCFEKSLI
ncbi:GNAT family N-acetyltransferase [Sporolactobacillus kofuensis]|uniref:GNAT family N-acetyltransferase n=1 Tax=Sporolactobacillus kofuensis TaxID=269672 RepID=A0ABW1WH99_9BACL|nr:GNAT family N-acetyltransferase [Sporolactobacillus kofuensis]MCO7176679.1 GNAT family N-acetyltransferase [Sporolactobacillus kofuensis]